MRIGAPSIRDCARLVPPGLSKIDISEAGEMRAVDLGEITHRPPRFVVEWTSGGSARSCARGSQWLWRASGSSRTPGIAGGAGSSRSARVSYTAALLCGRRVGPRARDAAEESV